MKDFLESFWPIVVALIVLLVLLLLMIYLMATTEAVPSDSSIHFTCMSGGRAGVFLCVPWKG